MDYITMTEVFNVVVKIDGIDLVKIDIVENENVVKIVRICL